MIKDITHNTPRHNPTLALISTEWGYGQPYAPIAIVSAQKWPFLVAPAITRGGARPKQRAEAGVKHRRIAGEAALAMRQQRHDAARLGNRHSRIAP
jgi:hypothetical protein